LTIVDKMQNVKVIGICGGSGSGKSTLAKYLQNIFSVDQTILLAQDSYYRDLSHLKDSERATINFDHPDSLEWDTLHKDLVALKSREPVNVPLYDFVTHTRQGTVTIGPLPIVILEGHLIFHHPEIRNLIDVKIFLENSPDILLVRRLIRDTVERGRTVKSVLDQYMQTVRPMYFDFVAPCAKWADLTFVSDEEMIRIANRIVDFLLLEDA
jgi:uridine kinase